MNPKLYPLPLDLTAKAKSHLVIKEPHDLTEQMLLENKVIVLNKGCFYKDSVIVSLENGETLIPNKDYQITGFNAAAYKLTAKEVCSTIVIKKKILQYKIVVTAQMVGGKFCDLGSHIANRLKGLSSNTRKLNYLNIKDIPDHFVLNGHMHPYWDLYSFTPRTEKIARMTDIYTGTISKDLDFIKSQYQNEIDAFIAKMEALSARYNQHAADKDNPHRLTAKQVALEHVKNGDIGALAEMHELMQTEVSKYLTPKLAKEFIDVIFVAELQKHIDNKNNPHKLTAEQVGTITNVELVNLDGLYYDRGETVERSTRFGGVKDGNNVTTTQGKTLPVLYNELRANLNAGEIKSGLLDIQNLATTKPTTQSVLVTTNGTSFKWLPISAIKGLLIKSSSTVYNTRINGRSTAASVVAAANSALDPNKAKEGDMMFVYGYHYYNYYWHNGTRHNYIYSLSIATISNGQWTF